MKIRELFENSYNHGHADPHAPELGSREKREFKKSELQHELGHETNNIAIAINGKTWKVVPCKGTADSQEEWKYLQHMKDWAERKTASSGKKWSVHLTGAPLSEDATAGATSAANIGTVVSPQLSPGKARGKKSYTGSVSTGSGTKAPPQPKVVQPKNSDGTAKNGLDMGNVFGGATIKR